uniref:Uncharacterized protein n=1 Tax=Parascaris equorum TaxID=6256 RepID=A0A914RJM5_PAREQ
MSLAERALQYFQSLPKNSDRAEVIIEQLADKTHLLYVEEDQTLQDCAEIDDHSSVGSCDIIQDYKKTGGHQSRTITTGALIHSSTLGYSIGGSLELLDHARAHDQGWNIGRWANCLDFI